MRLLHLAKLMKLGYGVSVMLDQLCGGLKSRKISCVVGCEEADDTYDRHEAFVLKPDPAAIAEFARKERVDAIVAYTTPFFECLPRLTTNVPCFVCECGDPTPEFFDEDAGIRRAIINNKLSNVYPFVNGVMTISDFIRSEICWPEAEVVRLGWEHAWKGAEPLIAPIERFENELICLGGLARLGPGEARYKGHGLFVELAQRLRARQVPVRMVVGGRGEAADAEVYDRLHIKVHLNMSDLERTLFYRGIDIFFSPSLWEGCNLPLVEAQANGALGLAFDTGAHPEYTPFVMRSVADIERLILNCASEPELLRRLRRASFSYITKGFGWDRSVDSFLGFLCSRIPA
jgi:glycosyltransferase involved in cell wall biosynthesis